MSYTYATINFISTRWQSNITSKGYSLSSYGNGGGSVTVKISGGNTIIDAYGQILGEQIYFLPTNDPNNYVFASDNSWSNSTTYLTSSGFNVTNLNYTHEYEFWSLTNSGFNMDIYLADTAETRSAIVYGSANYDSNRTTTSTQVNQSTAPNRIWLGTATFTLTSSISVVSTAPANSFFTSIYGTVTVNSTSAVSTLATLGSNYLQGLALDNAGNIYTTSNNTFYKINLTSKVVTPIAISTSSSLTSIKGMFFDNTYANLYVANTTSIYYSSNITAATPTFTLFATTSGTPSFNGVNNIAFDSTGNIYVTDYVSGGKGSIRKFTSAGSEIIPAYSSSGATSFSNPFGLAVDSTGLIYFTSTDIGAPIYKLSDAAGTFTTTILGGSASPAIVPSAKMGLTLDSTNNVFFCDVGNFLIRRIDATTGAVTNIGINANPGYNYLQYIATGTDLYVTDFLNNSGTIRKIGSNTVSFFSGFSANGTDVLNTFNTMQSQSASSYGTITSFFNSIDASILFFTFDSDNNMYFAGSSGSGSKYPGIYKIPAYTNTNIPEKIVYSPTFTPAGVAVDSAFNIYSTVLNNGQTNTGVYKISAGIATNIGTAVNYYYPYGVVIDTNTPPVVYVADYINNRIVKINATTGVYISSISVSNNPRGLAIDTNNTIYLTQVNNNTIYKFTSGSTTAIAIGTSATPAFSTPYGIAVDRTFNVYVVDTGNKLIRRIDAGTGAVTTIASTTSASPSSNSPTGIAIDTNGNLYFSDSATFYIYKVSLSTSTATTYYASTDGGFTYPTLYNGTPNTTTGYKYKGVDIAQYGVPYFTGSQAVSTGLKYGGNDFNALFLPLNATLPVVPNTISTLAYVASSVTTSTANFTFTTPTAPNANSGLVSDYYYPFYLNGSSLSFASIARVTAGASSMTMQIYSLVSNTIYSVNITANMGSTGGAVLQSSLSNSISILTIPDVPALTLITQTGTTTSITVSVVTSGNGTIIRYTGYAQLNGNSTNLTNATQSGSTFVFSGLTAASSYYCFLSATNSSGTGIYPGGGYNFYTVPNPITALTFIQPSPTGTNTNYTAVSFTIPSGSLTDFNLYVNQTISTWPYILNYSNVASTKYYYVYGLPTPGTAYTLYVNAYNTGGNSTNVSTTIYTPPSAPTIVFVSSSSTTINISITSTNTSSQVTAAAPSFSTTSYGFTTGIVNGQTYNIYIVAYAGFTTIISANSNTLSNILTISPPGTPGALTNVPGQATATSVVVTFAASSGVVTSYNAYINQTTSAASSSTSGGATVTLTVTGLTSAGSSYTLYVNAYNSAGTSANVSTNVYTSPTVSIYSVTAAGVTSSSDITQCNTTTANFNFYTTGAVTSYVVYVNGVVGSGSISGSVYTVTGLTNTTTQNTSIYLVASNNGALSVNSNTMTMKQVSFYINSVTYNGTTSVLTVNITFTGTLTKANFNNAYASINSNNGSYIQLSDVTLVSGSIYNITVPSAGTITTAGAVNYVTVNFDPGPTNYNTFYYSNSSGLRTVNLNFYPPSIDVNMWTGQGDSIMARSLIWAAGGNTSGPLRVLFLHANSITTGWSVDVKNKVTSYISSNFPAISLTFNLINSEAPDASSLTKQNYDVAMVATNFASGTNWGTYLNSFAQAKGGIILAAFANTSAFVSNFSYSSYSPIQTYANNTRLTGDVNLNTSSIVSHFITTGLTTFNAGTGLYGGNGVVINSGAQTIAAYNSGTSLIAVQTFA